MQAGRSTELEQAALDGSERFAGALVAGDADALAELLAPDFTYTHANALVEPRDELVASFREGRRYLRADLEQLSTSAYDGAAIVAGLVHMRVGTAEQPIDFDSRFTAVWVRVDGAPRLAAYHSTRVPAE